MCLCPLQINLIAPPRYVMTTTTLERTEGLSVLNQAMAAIKEKIEEKRGVFNIQMEVSYFSFFVQPWKWSENVINMFVRSFFTYRLLKCIMSCKICSEISSVSVYSEKFTQGKECNSYVFRFRAATNTWKLNYIDDLPQAQDDILNVSFCASKFPSQKYSVLEDKRNQEIFTL